MLKIVALAVLLSTGACYMEDLSTAPPAGPAVRMAPPTVLVESPGVRPYGGAVWIEGYWGWRGTGYRWVSGRWAGPRNGYYWQPHRYVGFSGHWRLMPGRWRRR